jgi:hypothetical protein
MWITVTEKMPPEREIVIVSQSVQSNGSWRNFAGWLDRGVWYCHIPKNPIGDPGEAFTAEMGDLRATDFWMTLPEWGPDCGVIRAYPA